MRVQPSSRQRELIALAGGLARERFAPRAERHDRDATFPFDDYADLRRAGLLGLCVPERYGGLGADFETYCLVAEQIAQGHASTALTFNMHCLTMLMMGPIADAMAMPPAVRERHEQRRAAKYREVIEDGAFYGQPHSEPVEQGETDESLRVGGRRFGTAARKVDGGYVVNGRKFFVSLAGAAPYYATPAIRLGDEPWIERTLYLQVARDAPGVSFPGEWDPMGMRATVSRDMVLENVFVPDEAEVLPPGLFGAMYNAFPHLFLSFSATFLGLMQAAYDGALAYLTGRLPGAPAPHSELAAKGPAVAEMLFAVESARALFYRAISEARVDPPAAAVQRARAAHVAVQRAVVTVTQEAIRVCGGRAFLKRYPLERHARDARAAALMRPWTEELATQQAWQSALGLAEPAKGAGGA
ncbi:MAG TPA: acyl-CoA dehydrogenase family protein [Stellaceae bacterium]|jgi:alkylation response protein AidB-like acyl-CoA dehydrogenase|nr:acyl-CoA dehydrogenase family protein [Stellaceae bacterium]